MIVIGERINASNSSVANAIAKRDSEYIANLVRSQAAAGADYIDLNAGAGKSTDYNEIETIEWLVKVAQTATDKPLAIDSESPDIIDAALSKYHGATPIINSVTAEKSRLESVGALAIKYQAELVALAMGEEGIPDSAEKRLATCDIIMTHLLQLGMSAKQVYFDPLVLPISVDSSQGMVTLRTLEQIKSRYPEARTVMGLSNISYGLPERKYINRQFLIIAAYAGLDAAILDPLDTKMMSLTKVADLLLGVDNMSRNYLKAYRKGLITD